MKGSDINNLMCAERWCDAHGWALPPNAPWDATDFGSGAWRQFGHVQVDLAEEPAYCEKLACAQGGMRTPAECHRSKQEDIICRWGVAVRVWSGRLDEQHRGSVVVPANYEPAAILSDAVIELDAESRIALLPELNLLPQECIFGEVSTANDQSHNS